MASPIKWMENLRLKLLRIQGFLNMPEPGTRNGGRLHRIFTRNLRILWMLARLDVQVLDVLKGGAPVVVEAEVVRSAKHLAPAPRQLASAPASPSA